MPHLVDWTIHAMSSTTEPEAKRNLQTSSRAVLMAVNKVIESAKVVAGDPKNTNNMQKVSAAYKVTNS